MKQSLQVIITLLNLKIIASNTITYRFELGICYKNKCMCGKMMVIHNILDISIKTVNMVKNVSLRIIVENVKNMNI